MIKSDHAYKMTVYRNHNNAKYYLIGILNIFTTEWRLKTMASRLKLQEELEALPIKKVYFQPPESVKLEYDCIVYTLFTPEARHANDKTYFYERRYQLTLITKDPDNKLIDEMVKLFKKCTFVRHFKANNLNHYLYDLYY